MSKDTPTTLREQVEHWLHLARVQSIPSITVYEGGLKSALKLPDAPNEAMVKELRELESNLIQAEDTWPQRELKAILDKYAYPAESAPQQPKGEPMKTHWTEWDIQHPQISGSPGFYGVLGREDPMAMNPEEITEYDRLKAQKTKIEKRQKAESVPTEEESREAFMAWHWLAAAICDPWVAWQACNEWRNRRGRE